MRLRSSVSALMLTAALALASCSPPTETSVRPTLSGQRVADGVRLVNSSNTTIVYTILEREYATTTLASWGPCAGCKLAPGQSVTIPLSEIGGYRPGALEAIVVSWTYTTDGTGAEWITDPREAIVPL